MTPNPMLAICWCGHFPYEHRTQGCTGQAIVSGTVFCDCARYMRVMIDV